MILRAKSLSIRHVRDYDCIQYKMAEAGHDVVVPPVD